MRGFFIFTLVSLLVSPFAVQAGQLSSADGQGQWLSTECNRPVAPAFLSQNAEARANDLNMSVAAHNRYSQDAKAYMECVSAEAGRDAAAMSKLIVDQASADMQELSDQVRAAGDALRSQKTSK